MKDNVLNKIRNNKQFVLLFICFAIFIYTLINVLNGNVAKFDISIYSSIISLKSNVATKIFRAITELGSATILIIIAVISYISIKNKKIGCVIVLNLAISALLNVAIKEMVQRPRPPIEFRMVEETSFSFPSGHSMTSAAFYGLIIYFIFKNIENKNIRNAACVCLCILIFLIGISRIYLGVHYASDVLAGFTIAIVYLILYINFALNILKTNE